MGNTQYKLHVIAVLSLSLKGKNGQVQKFWFGTCPSNDIQMMDVCWMGRHQHQETNKGGKHEYICDDMDKILNYIEWAKPEKN